MKVERVDRSEVAQACRAFVDAVEQMEVRHLGDPATVQRLGFPGSRSVHLDTANGAFSLLKRTVYCGYDAPTKPFLRPMGARFHAEAREQAKSPPPHGEPGPAQVGAHRVVGTPGPVNLDVRACGL